MACLHRIRSKIPALAAVILCTGLLLPAHAQQLLELQKVTDDVYAIVGPLTNRAPENFGNNATFGFVVTSKGVVLIDPGGTYKGAAEIQRVVRKVTDKRVKIVINTGGQDHRWLGNDYFRKQGARIIASRSAVEDQKERARDQLLALDQLVGSKGLEGTDPVHASTTFDDSLTFSLGGTTFEVHHPGPAHTPGDSFVWLPRKKVMFTGDIVYVERMLGVMSYSRTASWLKSFEAMAAYRPRYLVPGHGHPSTLAKAQADTYEYLKFLRAAVREFRESGKGIEDIGQIDQSRFGYLQNQELKGINAQAVYSELEWE